MTHKRRAGAPTPTSVLQSRNSRNVGRGPSEAVVPADADIHGTPSFVPNFPAHRPTAADPTRSVVPGALSTLNQVIDEKLSRDRVQGKTRCRFPVPQRRENSATHLTSPPRFSARNIGSHFPSEQIQRHRTICQDDIVEFPKIES